MSKSHQDPEITDTLLNFKRPFIAKKLNEKLKQFKSAPFVVIGGPSGSGKTWLVEEGIAKVGSGTHFALLSLADLTDRGVATALCDLIIEHHPSFSSRKSSNVFREKIKRCVERSPAEAVAKLRHMMQELEQEKFAPENLKLVVCLDGLDEYIKRNLEKGHELSSIPFCGNQSAPLSFLQGLLGMNSLLITLTYRDWVTGEVASIFSDIDESVWLQWTLDFPKVQEVNSMVRAALQPIREQNKPLSKDFDRLSKCLSNQLKNDSASAIFLESYLDELFGSNNAEDLKSKVKLATEGNHFVRYIAERAESVYGEMPVDQQLSCQEVTTKLMEDKLSFVKSIHIEELDQAIRKLIKERFVYIAGTASKVDLMPVHKKFLSGWERADEWMKSEDIIGLPELRKYREKALAWVVGDRDKGLLLTNEGEIQEASRLLLDKKLTSQLSAETLKFLTVSTEEPKAPIKLIKNAIIPMVCLLAIFAIISTINQLGNSDDNLGVDANPSEETDFAGPPAVAVSRKGEDERLLRIDSTQSLENSGESLGLTVVSEWEGLLSKMAKNVANKKVSLALDALFALHSNRVAALGNIEISAAEFEQFTSILSEISTLQDDQLATQAIWKYEFDKTESTEFCNELRLIMARLALNDGRKREAVAYVSNTHIQELDNPYNVDFVKAALDWHLSQLEDWRKLSTEPNSEKQSVQVSN